MTVNNLPLNQCKNWDYNNMCCSRFADEKEKFKHVNEKDFDNTCKGKSHELLCVWYLHRHTTMVDVIRRKKRYG